MRMICELLLLNYKLFDYQGAEVKLLMQHLVVWKILHDLLYISCIMPVVQWAFTKDMLNQSHSNPWYAYKVVINTLRPDVVYGVTG